MGHDEPLPYMENANVKAALSLAEAFYQPESDLLYFNYLVARYHGDIFHKKSMTELRLEVDEMKKTFMSIDQLEIPYQRVLFHKFLDALKEEDEIYQAFLDLVYANETCSPSWNTSVIFHLWEKRRKKDGTKVPGCSFDDRTFF